MASEISGDVVIAAFVFIAILFAVMSIPRLVFIAYRSWSVINKHVQASKLKKDDEIPDRLYDAWELRKDGMAFEKEIGAVMEAVVSLRSNITRAAVSCVIMTVLLIWPGFEAGIVIPMVIFCLILWIVWVGSLAVSIWVFTSCVSLLDEMPHSKHPEMMYG